MNDKERELLEMYESKGLGTCEICQKCRVKVEAAGKPPLFPPVGAFFVGDDFYQHAIRLLIVGKEARGKYEGYALYGRGRELYNTFGSHFWDYTKEIVRKVFGDASSENIAVTNIVQCNNAGTTRRSTLQCCVQELGAIREEIKIIRPNTVVFYAATGSAPYAQFIRHAFDDYSETENKSVKVGALMIPMIEGIGIADGEKVNVLNTWHPERKDKNDYTAKVAEWVKRVKIGLNQIY